MNDMLWLYVYRINWIKLLGGYFKGYYLLGIMQSVVVVVVRDMNVHYLSIYSKSFSFFLLLTFSYFIVSTFIHKQKDVFAFVSRAFFFLLSLRVLRKHQGKSKQKKKICHTLERANKVNLYIRIVPLVSVDDQIWGYLHGLWMTVYNSLVLELKQNMYKVITM